MRPLPFLNATKVFLLAIALGFSIIDISAARDIGERTIYRRDYHNRQPETRTAHTRPGRYRHDFRHERRADRRHDYRRDRRWRAEHRRDRRSRDVVRDYRRDRNWQPDYYYDGDSFPSTVPGIGTYAGGLSAWRDPGNGIYFSRESYGNYGYGDVNIDVDLGAYLGGPQILDVDPAAVDNACSYEKGVCVIRRR